MAEKRVAVIGAGLAGTAAAIMAKAAGRDVIMIADGQGATAFSSGGLDLAGDPCFPLARLAAVNPEAGPNLDRLVLREPQHPYALLSQGAHPSEAILELLRETVARLFPADTPFELAGEIERNQACLTALGTIKFTSLFPKNTARPGGPGLERPLVLGIAGLPDFEPGMWKKVAKENAARLGHHLEAASRTLAFGSGRERLTPALAAEIESAPDAFIRAVTEVVAGAEAGAVVLPPVLPLRGRSQILKKLESELGLPVYELLSLPPSVPGLRLAAHLEQIASAQGIERVRACVSGYVAENDRLTALVIVEGSEERKILADTFVLAAGKFLGGGLKKDRAFAEKIFGLPVTVGDSAPGELFIEKALGRNVTDPHALFAAGVRVDRTLRPLAPAGQPRFANLFAGGSILPGYNYLQDGAGAGVALATGAKAGKNAAESVLT